jgi:hypothetical protein
MIKRAERFIHASLQKTPPPGTLIREFGVVWRMTKVLGGPFQNITWFSEILVKITFEPSVYKTDVCLSKITGTVGTWVCANGIPG